MKDIELPPLPEPDHYAKVSTAGEFIEAGSSEEGNYAFYSSDDMQAYASAAVEADRAQRVPEDIVNYVRGIYAFLESVAPVGLAEEAFRLPPSATRNQEALFDSLPDHTPGGFPSSSGQVGGGERESQAAIGLSDLLASTPAQPAQKPAPWNESKQAALNDWFLSLPDGRREVLLQDKWMLAGAAFEAGRALAAPATAHQEPPQKERKPMTDREADILTEQHYYLGGRMPADYRISVVRATERHHGIKE